MSWQAGARFTNLQCHSGFPFFPGLSCRLHVPDVVKVHIDIDLVVGLTLGLRAAQQLRSHSWACDLRNHDGRRTWAGCVLGKVGIEVVLHVGELDCLGGVEDEGIRAAMVLSLVGDAVVCV